MIDDRIVLPLTRVAVSANTLCALLCPSSYLGPHDEDCLVPFLEQREQLLSASPAIGAVSGDCQDPIKHQACSGCACSCHRHSRRTP